MNKKSVTHNKNVSYAGKEVFVGIDVHKSFYVLSAISVGELLVTCRIPANARQATDFIKKRFSGANIKSCYEAGFSGFVFHRELIKAGIENIVVNPASIEVNARDRVKTDKRDSKKLAKHLSTGMLKSIRIPSEQEEQARLLSRTREQVVKSISRVRIQIRMKFHQCGLIAADDRRTLGRKMVREYPR